MQQTSSSSGEVPTMDGIFEPEHLTKGTAGTDAQGRHTKSEEEMVDKPKKKGTAGQDTDNRRWKEEEEE